MKLQYKDPKVLKVKITLKTWLHIGAWKENLKIGWIDSPVVKHPYTNEPYIPGSSLKGKMRALIEMTSWLYPLNAEKQKDKFWPTFDVNKHTVEIDWEKISIPLVFGAAKDQKIASRVLFSDFYLTEEWRKKFKEIWAVDFYEDKSENTVPRFLKWNTNPRQIERVPAGVEFEGEIVITPVEGENGISEDQILKVLKKWFEYLEIFWIGGNVSRWYWRIKIKVENEIENPKKIWRIK